MMETTRLNADQADFGEKLDALLAWEAVSDQSVETTVRDIIGQLRSRGDEALLALTNHFDRRAVATAAELEIAPAQLHRSLAAIDTDTRDALQAAAQRIRDYHERQRAESWDYTDAHGNRLGQLVRPLDRVGLYVPGGKAAYPSSVLMNSIPAKVAGVGELVMVVPAPDDHLDELVLAAAAIAGVDRLFTIGGAQAIAALAYGTDTVPAVDKIVGPGNIFVATAKREVFGKVGIDMIAGPSEICVVCDGQTDAEWIALDLFSQAEHDEDAQAILISLDPQFTDQVSEAMQRVVASQPRAQVIVESMRRRGCLIDVRTRAQALDIVNRIAPEHLELSVDDADDWLPQIRHAGAIFLGRYTPEALGDYCAGPNHVLPTAGTARFSSPLGVYDFQKRSSIIGCSRQGASALAGTASRLARGEGLVAHAQSAEARL